MKTNRHIHSGYASAVVLTVLVLATAAGAKTLHVDDDGKADFRSIAAAIDSANSGDVVVIEPGVYSGANEISGKVLTLRSRDPNDPAVSAGTVIDMRTKGYSRGYAFFIPAGANTRVTLAGLTIRNSTGSAIVCEGADLTLINCTFSNCATDASGGALNCASSRVRLTGCTFSANASAAIRGGAIYCSDSRFDLMDCTFESNKGCAVVSYDSLLNMTGCRLEQNSGEDGSAIHCRRDVPGEVVPGLNLSRCTFLNNAASASGGATYSYYIKTTVDACAFTSNRARQDGGAVYSSGLNITLGNSVFAQNVAGGTGGAVSTWYNSHPQIVNCTFVANDAVTGGAVAANGHSQVLVSHCILWDNTARQGQSLALLANIFDYAGSASANVEYSDVAGGQDEVHVDSDATLTWSRGNLDVDPLFLSRRDHSLKGRSPCIDAGDPSYTPASEAEDVAGNPRRSGATVDLGAYEAGPSAVYRFFSPLTLRHFYTISQSERDKLIAESASTWTFEGLAFYASTRSFADMLPIYRFWSPKQSSHFWTIDEKEAQKMMREQADQWIYEGIGYYAYPPYKQPWGTVPVYRFWWKQRGGHFFTASDEERDRFLRDPAWTYEGPVWYVFAGPHGKPSPVR